MSVKFHTSATSVEFFMTKNMSRRSMIQNLSSAHIKKGSHSEFDKGLEFAHPKLEASYFRKKCPKDSTTRDK